MTVCSGHPGFPWWVHQQMEDTERGWGFLSNKLDFFLSGDHFPLFHRLICRWEFIDCRSKPKTMKALSLSTAAGLASVLLTMAPAGSVSAATLIGNSASDRVSTDGYSGQVFLLNADTGSLVGQRVVAWSFFNNQNTSAVTPIIAEDLGGGSFAIRGIGATVVGSASGIQGGAFNLVSGTDFIGLNYYVGYYDGSWDGVSAAPNQGGVEFNSVDDPPVGGQIDSIGTLWIHGIADGADNPANIGVGALNFRDTTYGAAVDGRHYSVNFTADPIPEPTTVLLGGLTTGLFLVRRRR